MGALSKFSAFAGGFSACLGLHMVFRSSQDVKDNRNSFLGRFLNQVNAARPFSNTRVDSVDLLPANIKMVPRIDENSDALYNSLPFGVPSSIIVKVFQSFVIGYDTRLRIPSWVFECLTKDRLALDGPGGDVPSRAPAVDRSLCHFHSDISIHQWFRSINEDYRQSGYDRGHMANAANKKGMDQLAMCQTFNLCNIAPQVGLKFNRGKWKELEEYVRSLTDAFKNVYVFTGPAFLPKKYPDDKLYVKYEVIGKNNVAVPTHFFKVIVGEKENKERHLLCYILPNEPIPDTTNIHSFLCSLDAVERTTGLIFFESIPRKSFKSINFRESSMVNLQP